ncbi:hypothetical protein E2C01_077293 [Portunus trituberculatus]|uniref:Uncharacterized protein n=1 Tax=Portunus trituberculatus TaxID=210409 RepID=A0A5B7IPC2_PORTR|nr:hypothetical protein [Portunus trituberculatus]
MTRLHIHLSIHLFTTCRIYTASETPMVQSLHYFNPHISF